MSGKYLIDNTIQLHFLIYILHLSIYKHSDTGGISINLNNSLIKIIAIIGASAAGVATIFTLIDYFIKIIHHVR